MDLIVCENCECENEKHFFYDDLCDVCGDYEYQEKVQEEKYEGENNK